MKRVPFNDAWPESWKLSHTYDLIEVHGEHAKSGYAYGYAERRRHTLELTQRAAAAPARVLDVAAAQGNFTLALAERGYEMTWNDLRADLADYVRLKHERGIVHFAPGNVLALGFRACFDVVLITEVIEHVAHPDEFLSAVAEMLVPGGHVVMSTPNGGYLLNTLPKFSTYANPSEFESRQFEPNAQGHIFLLHEDEIGPLAVHAGLEVIEHRVFTNVLTNGHVRTAALLRVLPRGVITAVESAGRRVPFLRALHTSTATLFRKPA